MKVELIAIGDEIITGHTVDTNTVFIAKKLAEIGLSVTYKTAVGDDLVRMEEVFHKALDRADIVIVTGGLGPTDDDITKRAIVKVFKRNLVFHEDILEDLKMRFKKRGIEMPSINQNQALLPQGATFLANSTGSALGIVIEENGKIFVSMPGVPREMQVMTADELVPFLEAKIDRCSIAIAKIRTTGIFESALAELISPVVKIPENVRFAYLPSYEGVDLRIIAEGKTDSECQAIVAKIKEQIYGVAGKYIYGEGDTPIEEVVGKLLMERHSKVATAESCTAGMLAARFTDVPGSSGYFDRGVITYSNESKIEMLDVPPEIIEENGAVSSEVAEAMALGIREEAGVDYGIGITGIAGPDGGTEEKPVGTVFIAVAYPKGVVCHKFQLVNDRQINRHRSVSAALELLRRVILGIK
ncbi:MAG: competence/damage-inducible protein A [Candidatus Zixiibacteriota bacterium]